MKSLIRRLCKYMLGVLGFSAVDGCNVVADMYGPPVMPEYGVPTVEFRVSGMVRDSQDKHPIRGIAVAYKDIHYGPDTIYTDDAGKFVVEGSLFTTSKTELRFLDMDGTENGEYKFKQMEVEMEKIGDGDDRWFDGVYAAEDVVVDLEPVKD